jgi:AsmA protein
MPRWLRWTLLALAAALALLVAAAVALVATFDANRYKSVAVDWMKNERHRTLAIDGPIELSVFPRIAVRLRDVKLSEAGRAEEFASLRSAALSVQLLPLLHGALVVDRVEASGVRAVLTRDAKGQRNIDDLVAAPAQPPTSGGPAPTFDVAAIGLADVQLRLRDLPGAVDGELVVKELTTGRIASGVESRVRLVAHAAFKAPALQGDMTLTGAVAPDFATGAVRLADLDLAFQGELPGGLVLREATLAARRLAFDPTARRLQIDALKLRAKGSEAASPLEVEIDWPLLDAATDAIKGSALSGRLSLGGASALTASFKTGVPAGNFGALRIPALEATLASTAAARKLDATLRANLALQPAERAVALEALQLDGRLQPGGQPAIALALRGAASASPRAAQWTLAGHVGTSDLDSSGNVSFAGPVPLVKAQAKFGTLDLNPLLPPASAAPAAPTGAAEARIDLGALRSVNGSFALRAGSVAARQFRVAELRVDATLDGGVLRVPTLQAKAWGGAVDGSASADARGPRIALKATASGVDVNSLLKDLAGKDILEGRGRIALDVASTGKSVGEWRSHVAGTAALQVRDGAIKGINLAKALRQAKAALTSRQDASQRSVQSEKTDFSELSATLRIDDGIARNTDLDLKSPFLRVGGEGMADIGRGRIDYTARATVAATASGQGGADLAALQGLTVPVRLTGPFDAVDWSIQWSAAAAAAVKGKLEDTLRQRLGVKPAAGGASAPNLKDTLKGLFR